MIINFPFPLVMLFVVVVAWKKGKLYLFQFVILFLNHILTWCILMYGEWGPTPVLSINGYKYFITFIDDFSDYTWVYLFNTHANVLQIFHDFVMLVENKLSMTIKLLLSDSAREYMSNQFFF